MLLLPLLLLLELLVLLPVLALAADVEVEAGVDEDAGVEGLADDVDPPPEVDGPEEAGELLGRTGGGELGLLTTINGAPASVATLAGPIAAAISAPNASSASTATAAMRGVGSQEGDRRAGAGRGSAGPIPARTSLRPCSRIPAIMPATSGGSGPRRVPHSKQ